MKPWPRKIGMLDVAYGVILALLMSVIVVGALGWDALGGYGAGLVVGALALLVAEGR